MKLKFHDDGYYESNPEADDGPGVPPKLAFTPRTGLFDQIIREAEFIGIRHYLHPKLGNCYRYKYRWKGKPWWIDVTFDGLAINLWKDDGQTFTEKADDPPPEPPQEATD